MLTGTGGGKHGRSNSRKWRSLSGKMFDQLFIIPLYLHSPLLVCVCVCVCLYFFVSFFFFFEMFVCRSKGQLTEKRNEFFAVTRM